MNGQISIQVDEHDLAMDVNAINSAKQGLKRKGSELEGHVNKKVKREDKNGDININDLPIELLGEEIFKYFFFPYWIKFLSPVCKHWRHVIISSRLPKQLLLKSKNVWPSLYRSLGELKVDTLLVQNATYTSVALALDHAPHVHTLVMLSSFVSSSAARIPIYKNVTTLSVTSSSQLWLMTMFPNLAKLRIACSFNMKEHARLLKYIGTNLKELEIYPAETYPKNELQKIGAIPSLTKIYVQCRKTQRAVIDFNVEKFVFTDLFVANDKISSLPYHEYFNMTGKTKLAEMMQKGDVDRVTELLFTETTKEYEQDFQIRRINFKFPFLAMQFPTLAPPTSSNKLSGNVKSVLLANNYFPYWETFSCLVDLREYDKAIEHLQELPQNLPVPPNIPTAVLTLLTEAHQTRIMSILEHNLGPEILKPLFAAKDEGGISLSHHLAVKVGHNDLMKYVDPKLLTGSGENLATVAFNNGKFARWLDCIVSGVDIQLQKYNADRFKTLFNSASGENDLQMITEFLFNSGEDSGEPFLFTAIKYLPLTKRNDDKAINPVIEILLRCHGHADLYDKNGRSLLNALIRTASRLKCPISLLKKLLKEYKTDMNHVDKEGKTPLTTAIDMQDKKMTFNLLRSKAVKHDQPDGSGITPFMKFLSKAETSDEFFYSTLLNFLDRGVDLNELDFDECGREMFPISIALQCGQSKDRIQSLVSRGCDLSLVDLDLNTVFHALLLCESDDYVMQMIPYLASRAPINAENSYGNSPIKIALLAGRREEIIQKLTENGAEISLYSALRIMTHPNQVKGLVVKSIDLTQIVPCIRHICQHWDPASVKNLLSDDIFVARIVQLSEITDVTSLEKSVRSVFKLDHEGSIILEDEYTHLIRLFLSHIRLTKFLIEQVGFDINTQNSVGETLLFHVNLELDNFEEITNYLLSEGIDVHIENSSEDPQSVVSKLLATQSKSPNTIKFLTILWMHISTRPVSKDSKKIRELLALGRCIHQNPRTNYFQKLPVLDDVSYLRQRLHERQKQQKRDTEEDIPQRN